METVADWERAAPLIRTVPKLTTSPLALLTVPVISPLLLKVTFCTVETKPGWKLPRVEGDCSPVKMSVACSMNASRGMARLLPELLRLELKLKFPFALELTK